MPLAPEMHVLDRKISSYQQFVPCRDTQHRAVIPDTSHQRRPTLSKSSSGEMADSLDQLLFAKWHADPIYRNPQPPRPRRHTNEMLEVHPAFVIASWPW